MIIGIATLITILFFGSFQDTLLIPGMDKSVKEFIFDEERRSHVLEELQTAQKEVVAFQKIAKKDFSALRSYNLLQDATLDQFNAFYDKRKAARMQIVDHSIERRLRVQELITDAEWVLILKDGEGRVKDLNEKYLKKESKGNVNDALQNVRITIDDVVRDNINKDAALRAFKEFEGVYQALDSTINAQRRMENEIIKNKYSTKDQLQKMADEQVELRKTSYDAVVKFHFKMLQVLDEKEWLPVMKSFNRILG